MNKLNKYIYLTLFAVLYIAVAVVSTLHAIAFFGLANAPILATILAITFEVGQATVLFSILTSPGERKKVMPWVLMCILTLVQILGNIFSTYKYMVTNSIENLRFFKEPIFIWTELPDNQTTVILSYVIGAILPIVALSLTEMVTSYLSGDAEKGNVMFEETTEPLKTIEPAPSETDSGILKPVEEPSQSESDTTTIESISEEIPEEPVTIPNEESHTINTEDIVSEKPQVKTHFVNM